MSNWFKIFFILLFFLYLSCSGIVNVTSVETNPHTITCDSDNDGFDASGELCGGTDCNDENPAINIDGEEVCDNGEDDDCNGVIDTDCVSCDVDEDGYLAEGYTCGGNDCNDLIPSVNPGVEEEICFNEYDDNCSGEMDEECPDCFVDSDEDGHYQITAGCPDEGDDCNDSDGNIYPGAEKLCDGQDNNCNGITDEGCSIPTGCGNNVLEIGEQCDDGNENPNDGCNDCIYTVPDNGQVHWVDKNNVMGMACNDSGNGQNVPWCNILPIDSHSFSPGDSIVIRSGTYNAYGRNRTDWTWHIYTKADVGIRDNGTSENPIVLMTYPGEDVILQNEFQPDINIPRWGYAVIGSFADHVIIQGFKVEGTFLLNNSDYNIVRGNEFQGLIGEDANPTSANYAGTMLYENRHSLVRNNLYKDYRGNEADNNSAVLFYNMGILPTSTNNIVENNDFINNHNGIFDKDNARWNVFRKNYFTSNSKALKGAGQDWETDSNSDHYGDPTYGSYNDYFYQNLVVNNGSALVFTNGRSHAFFNNVIINSPGFEHSSQAAAFATYSFFNNIFVTSNESSHSILKIFNDIMPEYMDYNMYDPFSFISNNYSTWITTLSGWQDQGFDLNSQEIEPGFADTLRYTLEADSPARGAGRHGEDLGLYPDGNEDIIIGRP